MMIDEDVGLELELDVHQSSLSASDDEPSSIISFKCASDTSAVAWEGPGCPVAFLEKYFLKQRSCAVYLPKISCEMT